MTGATIRYYGFGGLTHLSIMRRGLTEFDQHVIDDILRHEGLSQAIEYAASKQQS